MYKILFSLSDLPSKTFTSLFWHPRFFCRRVFFWITSDMEKKLYSTSFRQESTNCIYNFKQMSLIFMKLIPIDMLWCEKTYQTWPVLGLICIYIIMQSKILSGVNFFFNQKFLHMALKTIKIRFEDMIDKWVSSPSFNSSSKFEFYIGIIFWKIKGNLFQLFTRMRYLLLSHKKLKTCATILGLDFYMLSWKTISKFYWLKKEICDA